jgi:hypothetical protein
MRFSGPLLAILVMTFTIAPPGQARADSILTCTFTAGTAEAYRDVLRSKPIELSATRTERPWSVVFAGLDTAEPRLKGNAGESKLVILERAADTVWLGERPALGGINVWTVFLDSKTATMTKQYPMLGNPFALMSMGTCK